MILLLLSQLAFAADAPERPEPPKPVAGQCERVYGINEGQQLPTSLVVDPGFAACSAVAVPLSDYADLLATEEWAKHVAQRYEIDTASLERDLDWYKAKLDEANKPVPWMEKPATQRWFGRIETLAVVVVVSAGLVATYYYTSGAGK